MPVTVTVATAADADELAEVAAATFPLACPPTVRAEDVGEFIAAQLSPARFADYLADTARVVLAARDSGRILGYAMGVRGVGEDPDVVRAVAPRPAVELSKIYVLRDWHGAGVAAELMAAAVRWAADGRARCVWLGVNQNNLRAQGFYRRHGFEVAGTRTFQLGAHTEHDFVMVHPL